MLVIIIMASCFLLPLLLKTDLLEANWLNGLPVLPAFLFLLLLSVILLILSAGITVKIFQRKELM